jgi:O-antigen ligase
VFFKFSHLEIPVDISTSTSAFGPKSVHVRPLLWLALSLAVWSWLDPNHHHPWPSFQGQAAMACAGVLFSAWVLVTTWRNGTLKVPAWAVFTSAAAFVPWVQWMSGMFPFIGDAWITSLYLLAVAVAITVGFRCAQSYGLGPLVQGLAGVVLTAGILSTGIVLYQWMQLDYLWVFIVERAPGAQLTANLAQPNLLGLLLVMSALGTTALYAGGRMRGWCALLTIVFLYMGVGFAQSRASVLTSVVATIWLWFAVSRARCNLTRRDISAGVLGATLGICLTVLAIWSTSSMVGLRPMDAAVSGGTRPTHWMSMIDAIGRKPWLGYGWNQVNAAQFAVAPDHAATAELISASHNLALDLLVFNGIPLGLALSATLLLWFFVAFRRAATNEAVLGTALVLAVFTHSMVEFPNEYTYFLLPVALLMGGVAASCAPGLAVSLPRSAGVGLLAMVTTALVATVIDYGDAETNYFAGRFKEARIGIDRPTPPPAKIRLLSQIDAFLQFANSPERDLMSDVELQQFENVARRYPGSSVVLRWAAALARNGHPEDAQSALRRICKTHDKASCEAASESWRKRGLYSATVAAVPWPEE